MRGERRESACRLGRKARTPARQAGLTARRLSWRDAFFVPMNRPATTAGRVARRARRGAGAQWEVSALCRSEREGVRWAPLVSALPTALLVHGSDAGALEVRREPLRLPAGHGERGGARAPRRRSAKCFRRRSAVARRRTITSSLRTSVNSALASSREGSAGRSRRSGGGGPGPPLQQLQQPRVLTNRERARDHGRKVRVMAWEVLNPKPHGPALSRNQPWK